MMAAQPLHHGIPLSRLLGGGVRLPEDPLITNISLDSRRIRPGGLFLALRGTRTNGEAFIDAAIGNGAAAVLLEAPADAEAAMRGGVPILPVASLRWRGGEIAARFYDDPSHRLRVVGITGTNGKTSCSHFLAQALEGERPVGVIGTLGNGPFGRLSPSGHTTPDAVSVQALLADLRDEGVRDVMMEVSSHGLDQGRVHGVHFHTALFTNLSRDHLDYHPDMTHYGRAKRRLFTMPTLRNAVINADDPFGRELMRSLPAGPRLHSYSLEGRAEAPFAVLGEVVEQGPAGLRVTVRTPLGEGEFQSPLLGRFNAGNLLAVLTVLLVLEVPLERALARLPCLRPVPGRMERFGGAGTPLVVVDYAHTPDALEQALRALRGHGKRLWCVFGCGGERDRGKRPRMGNVAARYAEELVITDDNPRGEDPAGIVEEILAGVPDSARVSVCHDRAAAIRRAIRQAGEEEVILVAGKGHEQFQQVGDEKRPFSDREVVRQALAAREKGND